MSIKIIPKTELFAPLSIDKSNLRDYNLAINPVNGIKEVEIMVYYPILIGEMAKREVSKKAIARSIGICDKSFKNKLTGKVPFTWPEVKKIHLGFFPDILPDQLFATSDELDNKT